MHAIRVLLRRGALAALLATALGVALTVGTAHAAYPGHDGEQAYDLNSYNDTEGGPPYSLLDTLQTRERTLTACTNSDPSVAKLACSYGAPSYSPGGSTLVVSRTPQSGAPSLMLLSSDGTGARVLAPLTADDEQPSFLPSGRALVFAGRASAHGETNLYSADINGRGLRRLTSGGGGDPAPCANGSIAYIRGGGARGRLYLRRTNGVSRRLSTLEASAPSCAPDSRTIAFIHQGELYVVAANGRGLRLVTSASGYGPKDEPDSGSGAFADTFAPDGGQIAMLVDYNLLSSNGSEEALVSVNLHGRRTARKLVIGDSSFSGDSGQSNDETSVGLSWEPLRSPDTTATLLHGSPCATSSASPVTEIAFGPGARQLATVSAAGGVSLFTIGELHGTQRLKRLAGLPAAHAEAVALSPNGRFIAVGTKAGEVSLDSLDPSGIGAPVTGSQFTAPPGVDVLSFSSDGGVLAELSSDATRNDGVIASSAPQDVTVAFLDAGTGALMHAPEPPVSTGPAGGLDGSPPTCDGLAFQGDSDNFAASATLTNASSDQVGAIQLFGATEATGTVSTGASVALAAPPSAGGFVPCPGGLTYTGSGTLLGDAYGFGSVDSGVLAWSLAPDQTTTSLLPGVPLMPTASWTLGATAISPGGRLLAASIAAQTATSGPGGGNGEISLASLDPAAQSVAAGPFWTGQNSVVDALAISPSDRLLATGNDDGTASLFALHPASR